MFQSIQGLGSGFFLADKVNPDQEKETFMFLLASTYERKIETTSHYLGNPAILMGY